MAFFSSGSRALVEILTRMQSAERPMPVDHTFFEFGSIRYHVEASASDPENVYVSISTPSLYVEASPPSTGLPETTLQETRKTYRKFAEIVEPPREGYLLTLRLNFSGLPRPKDRARAINQVSRLQAAVLSSQLKDALGRLRLDPSETTTRLVYGGDQREPFFVSKTWRAGCRRGARRLPHAVQGRHGPGHRDVLLPGASGAGELVQEGAHVQLVADPAAGAARAERAPPHYQRRLRLLRRVVAARAGEASRQDGVDPAQLPGLRQVPRQVHEGLHPEQTAGADGGPGRGGSEREAAWERRREEAPSEEEEGHAEKADPLRWKGQQAAAEGPQRRPRQGHAAAAADPGARPGPAPAALPMLRGAQTPRRATRRQGAQVPEARVIIRNASILRSAARLLEARRRAISVMVLANCAFQPRA